MICWFVYLCTLCIAEVEEVDSPVLAEVEEVARGDFDRACGGGFGEWGCSV